jgi:RimJ/RimL family protein N-acetyltransferase
LNADDVTHRYVEGINDPAVRRFLISAKRGNQTIESVRSMVLDDWNAPDAILFGIFVDGVHCGNVRLHGITLETAQIGAAVFDTAMQQHGYGSAAIAAVARYAVEGLGARRVIAGIDHRNDASRRAFGRAGFHCVANDPEAEGSIWYYP